MINDKLSNETTFTVSHHSTCAATSTLLINIEANFTEDHFKCEFTNSRGETDSRTFKVYSNKSGDDETCGKSCSVGFAFAGIVFLILIALLGRAIHFNKVREI